MPYSPSADPLLAAADLRARGAPFVMATVVQAVAPTSAKPGDKAVLTNEGMLVGWVGGSCAEPIVKEQARRALADGECRLVLITAEDNPPAGGNGVSIHRMECYSGGTLQIYLEPFLAPPRLLVFGNSPVARALCDLGALLRYAVTVVDLGDRPPMGADLDIVRSIDAIPPLTPERTFAVVSSHGGFDEESLAAALALGLSYTGFVTSRKRREQVFEALSARGVNAEALGRVRAPAGIDIGARQPEEIALSVMAEIVKARRSAEVHVSSTAVPSSERAVEARGASAAEPNPGRVAEAREPSTVEPSALGAAEPPAHIAVGEAQGLVTLTRKAKSCCHDGPAKPGK